MRKYIHQPYILCLFLGLQVLCGQSLLPPGITPDGSVSTLHRKGNRLYVGGFFDKVGYQTGAAAYLPQAGDVPDLFVPRINGDVFAIVPDGQGGWYLGGEFDEAGIYLRLSNIVHFRPNFTVDPNFQPAVNNRILAMAVKGDTLFIGGRFTHIGSVVRTYLAAFQISTGALLPWNPAPTNWVTSLEVYQDKLIVGGQFSNMGDKVQPGLAMIDLSTDNVLRIPCPQVGTVNALELAGDTLYVGGSFSTTVGTYTGAAAMYVNGSSAPLDSFPAINGIVEVILPDPQGGWYLGGSFTSVGTTTRLRLARIKADYTLDQQFDIPCNSTVYTLALAGDTLYVGGAFRQMNNQAHDRLAAINLTSQSVLPWHPAPNQTVKALYVDGSQVYVGGHFTRIGGIGQPKWTRLDRSTGLAARLPGPVNGEVRAFQKYNDTILVGGSFNNANGLYTGRLAHFQGNSATPQLGGIDVNGTIYDMIADGNGGWYIGGAFTQVNGRTQRRLAHILANGSLDTTLEVNVNSIIRALALKGDTLCIAGNFTRLNNVVFNRLAAYSLSGDSVINWHPDVNGTVFDLFESGGHLFVGGAFTTVGGQTRNRLARFDLQGLGLQAWQADINGTVYRLGHYDTMLYISGAFTSIGGVQHRRLAEIGWNSGAATTWDPNINNTVLDFSIDQNQLYLAGAFTQVDGTSRLRLASIDLSNHSLLPWNPAPSTTVQTLWMAGDSVFVGGNFTSINGTNVLRLAVLDKGSGVLFPWYPNFDQTVQYIRSLGPSLWVGGNFQVADYQDRDYVMAVDVTQDQLTDWAPQPNGAVEDLLRAGDKLYLAGSFRNIMGQARTRLAKVDVGTGQLDSWAPDIDNTVYDIDLWNDTMMVAGRFTMINGQGQSRAAAIDAQTANLINWNPGISGVDVRHIIALGQGVFLGGNFKNVNAETRNRFFAVNLAQLSLTDWAPQVSGFFFPTVYSLLAYDTTIYASGTFGNINGQTRSGFGAIGRSGGILPLDLNAHGPIYDLAIVRDTLLVVGEFDSLQGQSHPFAAKVDLANQQLIPWNLKPDWAVWKVLADTGGVMIGGEIDMLQTHEREGAFALDARTGTVLPWHPSPNFLGGVNKILTNVSGDQVIMMGYGGQQHLQVFDADSGAQLGQWNASFDGRVYDMAYEPCHDELFVVGAFSEVGSSPRSSIAAFDGQGNLLPFQANIDNSVFNVAVLDSLVFIAGTFSQVNGQVRQNLASFHRQGALRAWSPQVSNIVTPSVNLIETTNDRVYVAGNFTAVDGEARNLLAAVHPISGQLLNWKPEIDPSEVVSNIRFIEPLGNGVLVGGGLSKVGAKDVFSMAYIGELSGLPTRDLPFLWQKKFATSIQPAFVSAAAGVDELVYVGGDFELVDGLLNPNSNYPFLATLDFPMEEFGTEIDRYTPQKGANSGDVTLQITGYGFLPGTRVKLAATGLDTLVGLDTATIIYNGGTYLEATFVLRDETPGLRDLIIDIPGDTAIVIPQGFEVLPPDSPDVFAEVIFPPVIRSGTPTDFYLVYGNNSFEDAVGVPIFMVTSPNMDLLKWEVQWLPLGDTTVNIHPDSIPQFVPIDSLYGESYEGKAYALIIPKINAQSAGMIRFKMSVPQQGQFYLRAWAIDPMYGSPLKYLWGECIDKLAEIGVGFVPGAGCAWGAIDAMLSPALDWAYDPENFGTGGYVADYFLNLVATLAQCGLDLSTGGVATPIYKAIQLALNLKDLYDILDKCWPKEEQDDEEGEASNSFDPNDKTGPPGQGDLGWIRTDRELTYLIRFENVDSAGLPASTVIIRDTLDPAIYDLSSLEVVAFTIADSLYHFPLQSKTFERWVDMRPRIPSLVQVNTSLDDTTGEMVWTFDTKDPATLAPNPNPFEGFLPPNVDSISGTGSVLFRIRTHKDILSGSSIPNAAGIYFDNNPPIQTNTWLNTADNDRPNSQVLALTDTQDRATFEVSWSGNDLGAGIRVYDLWVSKNGDPFEIAIFQTSDTATLFEGEPGSRYAFFTTAVDTALNREKAPSLPDTETYLPLALSRKNTPSASLQVAPNPNDGSFRLEGYHPKGGVLQLRLHDLLGKSVFQDQHRIGAGTYIQELQLELSPGAYLLTYQIDNWKGSKTLIIQP